MRSSMCSETDVDDAWAITCTIEDPRNGLKQADRVAEADLHDVWTTAGNIVGSEIHEDDVGPRSDPRNT